MCYAQNVAPKEALIVKEWNITGKKTDSIAKFSTLLVHCEKVINI